MEKPGFRKKYVPSLPKTTKKIKNAFINCKRDKKAFRRADKKDHNAFIKKAFYDLEVGDFLHEEGYGDWAVISYCQAMLMAANAMLSKYTGYYSKDYVCAAIALLKLKEEEKAEKLREVKEFIEKEIDNFDKIRLERNALLYIPFEISEKDVRKYRDEAVEFVDKINMTLGDE